MYLIINGSLLLQQLLFRESLTCLFPQMILFLYFLIKCLDFIQDLTGDTVCKLKGGTGKLEPAWPLGTQSVTFHFSAASAACFMVQSWEFHIVSKN